MRYRKLDSNNDFVFGRGQGNFLVNTPETVAQAVQTRLALSEGEWFLDNTEGTPYNSKILGAGHMATYDSAIQQVIINTTGVRKILAYSSNYDASIRKASIQVTIDTVYGITTLSTTL